MNIDNITSEDMTLTYNGKAMLIKVYEEEIERLKEQLNDEIDDELKQSEIMVKKQEEIERLNNIINEIGKYLWEERYNHHGEYVLSGRKAEDIYTLILDKLEELKGADKE